MLNTPILFLIFNRPDTTQQVFETIRQAKPKQLFIAADGPRANYLEEVEKCARVREIALQIDWACEVKTLFRNSNMGCKMAVSSAINWFFDYVEEGIILEDDCLPDSSFFMFCTNLLNHYRNNEKVMHIGGVNLQSGKKRGRASYYFSHYNHIWGWATWRRAWKYYDIELRELNTFIENKIHHISTFSDHKQYWIKAFTDTKEGKINTWDYQWTFSIWNKLGLSVLPNVNLIKNIGFGEGSTHTSNKFSKYANLKVEEMNGIIHPNRIIAHKAADRFTFNHFFNPPPSLPNKVRNYMYKHSPVLSKFIQQFKKVK